MYKSAAASDNAMKPPVQIPSTKPVMAVKQSSFFEAQVWRRRSAAGWSALITLLSCAIAGAVAVLLVVIVVLYVTLLSRLLPARVGSWLASGLDVAGGSVGIVVISIAITAACWYFGRRIFKRDTTAGLLGRLQARPAQDEDEQEQQLVETVRKTAMTARMPMPALLVFDAFVSNAAAIGDEPGKAGLLISRELLDTLEPAKVDAVVAHLLSSVANGDLGITDSILRGRWLMGTMATVLDVPFSRRARTTLAVLARHAFPSNKKPESSSADVDEAFARMLHPDGLESLSIFMRKLAGEENDVRSIAMTVLSVLLLPVLLIRAFASVICSVMSLLLLGPTVTLVLRGRRKLADTTAGKLSKGVGALSSALVALSELERNVPSMGWSEMSFIVGPEPAGVEVLGRFRVWTSDVLSAVNNFSSRSRRKPAPDVSTNPERSSGDDRITTSHELVFGFHPPIAARVAALNRLSSPPIASSPYKDPSTWVILGFLLLGIGCVLVFALPALRRWM